MTPYAALLDRIRHDAASPLVTFRDLATGERMELSAASLGNAVAKTAGLIRDELDAEPGDVIAIHLPLHWQRIVWLGACAATGTVFAPDAQAQSGDILVIDRSGLDLAGKARETVLVSLSPFGLPEPGGAPPGVTDAAVAMRGHPDEFVPWEMPAESAPMLRTQAHTLTQTDVMEHAAGALARRGIGTRERFAIVDPDPLTDVLGLTGPLITGGGIVLIANPASGDLEGTLREEGARRTEGSGHGA